jgi:flavin-dependent dehydrogenase
VLDALLADAAAEAGVEIVRGARVTGLLRDAGGRVGGVEWVDPAGRLRQTAARVTIGADGVRSTVARLAGAMPYYQAPAAAVAIYGYYPLDGAGQGNRWFFRPGVSAGAIPTNDGLSCVFASLPPARFARQADDVEALFLSVIGESNPALGAAVATTPRASKLFAFPGLAGYMRQSHGPGWALVGDAGYFKDPATAHGITDALRDAELLARAIAQDQAGALADYQRLRDALSLELCTITERIASFDWDLAELQRLHVQLSDEMTREGRLLAALDANGNALPSIPGAARRAS